MAIRLRPELCVFQTKIVRNVLVCGGPGAGCAAGVLLAHVLIYLAHVATKHAPLSSLGAACSRIVALMFAAKTPSI